MKNLFRALSAIFSPLILPCYSMAVALWFSPLSALSLNIRWRVLITCFLILTVAPAGLIYIIYKMGIISDPGLNERKDRAIPYILTMMCYVLCGYYLYMIKAPIWLIGIIAGAMLTILVNLIVNHWWKISGHMAGMGGMLGVLMFLSVSGLAVLPMLCVMAAAIVITGLVGTARLALNRHTFMQVIAGTANGFICVYICATLFDKI